MSTKKIVSPAHMKCGDVGVVRRWLSKRFVGLLAYMRDDNSLVMFGKRKAFVFDEAKQIDDKGCGVEVLYRVKVFEQNT